MSNNLSILISETGRVRVGEMIQWLGPLAAHAEDLRSVPSSCNFSTRGSEVLFLPWALYYSAVLSGVIIGQAGWLSE